MTITERISKLMNILTQGLMDREDLVRLGFLSIIAEQPIYLYGRSGSGKKIIIDRLIKAFRAPKVQQFGRRNHQVTEKSEPYSITIYNSFDGSNPSMANSVQIIMEERLTRALILSGHQRPDVALNEAGIADCIHLVLSIPDTISAEALLYLLKEQGDLSQITVPQELMVSTDEWNAWLKDIQEVQISEDTFNIISAIATESEKNNIYISAKRWRGIARIIKAAAFFSGRKETGITDTLFLGSNIWGKRINNESLLNGFHKGLNTYLANHAPNINDLEAQLLQLQQNAEKAINASNDVFRTISFNNMDCIRYTITVAGEAITLYAPVEKIGTREDFHPFNELRHEETRVKCNYMGSSICLIAIDSQAKRTGMRASTNTTAGTMTGKKSFEEFAKLPTEVIRTNDPEKIRQNKDAISNLKQMILSAIETNAKALMALKTLYTEQKKHQDDPFLNKSTYQCFMEDLARQFKKVSENVQALQALQEVFLQKTTNESNT